MEKIFRKIKWFIDKKKLKKIGENSYIGKNYVILNLNHVEIGDNFYAADNFKIRTWEKHNNKETDFIPKVKIGDNVMFNENCYISCLDEIVIGNNCLFGDNVFITDNYHGNSKRECLEIPPIERNLETKGKTVIGKNVWCGRNVSILSGISIGNNVIIGANAVVTHSFEDNVVIGGVPAKIIKKIV